MFHITLFSIGTLGLAAAGLAMDASALQMAAASTESAVIKTFQFQPKTLEVRAGATVTWTNEDGVAHTVTSGTPESPSGIFDSGAFGKGQSFSTSFAAPGEYAYFCAKHKSMRGSVKVLPSE
jgi:plastocyanin